MTVEAWREPPGRLVSGSRKTRFSSSISQTAACGYGLTEEAFTGRIAGHAIRTLDLPRRTARGVRPPSSRAGEEPTERSAEAAKRMEAGRAGQTESAARARTRRRSGTGSQLPGLRRTLGRCLR